MESDFEDYAALKLQLKVRSLSGRRCDKKARGDLRSLRQAIRVLSHRFPIVPHVDSENEGRAWQFESTRGPQTVVLDCNAVRELDHAIATVSRYIVDMHPDLRRQHSDHCERMTFFLRWLNSRPRSTGALSSNREFLSLLAAAPIADRWKSIVAEMLKQVPRLQRLLTELFFFELTSPEPASLERMVWLNANAERVGNWIELEGSTRTVRLLWTIQPNMQPEWSELLMTIAANPTLAFSRCYNPFADAEGTAERIREAVFGSLPTPNDPRDCETFLLRVSRHIEFLFLLKRDQAAITSKFGSLLVGRDFIPLQLNCVRLAQSERRRLCKLKRRMEESDPESFVAQYGSNLLRRITKVDRGREGVVALDTLLLLIERSASVVTTPRSRRVIEKFLDKLNSGSTELKYRLFWEWFYVASEKNAERVLSYLPAFTEILGKPKDRTYWLDLWSRCCRPTIGFYNELVFRASCAELPVSRVRKVLRLTGELVQSGISLHANKIAVLAQLVRDAPDMNAARTVAFQLVDHSVSQDYLEHEMEAAWYLSPDGSRVLELLENEIRCDPKVSSAMMEIAKDSVAKSIFRTLAHLDKDTRKGWVVRLGIAYASLRLCGAPCSPIQALSNDRSWIGNYPNEFRHALERLADVDVDAERFAENLAKRAFLNADRLACEIETLKRILECGSDPRTVDTQAKPGRYQFIAARIVNLEQRLSDAKLGQTQFVRKVLQQLEERADRARLERIYNARIQAVYEKLAPFGKDKLPDWFCDPQHHCLLQGLASLPKRERELALAAITNCRSDTMSLVNEPANRAYLEKLEAAGIRTQPWLDDQFTVEANTADGSPYTLRFTRDPIDLLKMGEYFGTCLSSDGINFYSTVSNLVDANKRVVFARTGSGELVGRCLLVLNSRGEIQSYHRYAFSPQDGFPEAVNRFVEQLAAAMNTKQTDVGSVPCLVSKRWYDDGCVPVPSPEHSSYQMLIVRIRTSAWHEVKEDLSAMLVQPDTEQWVIDQLIHDSIQARKEFAYPLLSLCNEQGEWADRIKLKIAANAWAYGVFDEAKELWRNWNLTRMLRRMADSHVKSLSDDPLVLRFVTETNPSAGLLMIRRTRSEPDMRDEDERSSIRRGCLTRIYDLLNRPTAKRRLSERDLEVERRRQT